MSKYVYSFGGGTAEGDGTMKDSLGGKGAGLASMCRAGVPVPGGFTIITDVCNVFFDNDKKVPKEVDEQIWKALDQLEALMGKKLGDAADPLLLSVRSGAKFSMPGMMNTILNLGLNDKTTKGLSDKTGNPRFAYDCYRRFIQMFGEVAFGVEMEHFDHAFDTLKAKKKYKLDTEMTADDLKVIVEEFKKIFKKHAKRDFPQDAREQLLLSRNAVFMSWWAPKASYYRKMEKISDRLGTACNIQAMVFGNMGDTSATGVGFTRDPGSGEKVFYGEFLVNAQGEDVVAGIRTPSPISELKDWNADVYNQLRDITSKLELSYKDMQDFEFTVQEGVLWMLQTRNGKRTGPAAVRVAVDMVTEGLIDEKTAVMRVAPAQLDQLLHPVFDTASLKSLTKLATGIDASPGAAVGRLAFTSEDAVEMSAKSPVILIRKETTPDDIHGMDAAKGILTAVGGKSSHAAVVARGMGVPCVVGCGAISINERGKVATVKTADKTVTIKEGDWVSIDGATGGVYLGQAATKDPDPNSPVFAKFMKMADVFRGKFGVRANADIPRDAKAARAFGAEGIGLCRTEHMFFAEDRLPHVQAMILTDNVKDRTKALAKLLPMQRKDFAGLFEAMNGFPVVIRTLDPPLHEFVPKREELMVDLAKLPTADIKTKKEMLSRYKNFAPDVKSLKTVLPQLLARVEQLHEFNPMLGHRGCRLGITYPEITEMQARAIFEAVVQVAKKGKTVIPEVMIPLIGGVEELENQKKIVKAIAEEVLGKAGLKKQKYMIGTMIEIPRAALTADRVATEAEFFSFGTNDLTQTTMGLSRDDYTKFSKEYEEKKIFKNDPFGVIDREGVGKLIKLAVDLGRSTNPELEIGICGEHGGDPSSVEFCYQVGMDYVSCSPYRVPIARLAAAQAAIAKSEGSAEANRTA
ncbi:pyruvate, phosphate dikinase [Paludibaculum fermentans]|uniref:Pyruvate, phosphate dikinase n=1 Tax=Paludibaculum fermentans TaxID=1473598 RepID=A0A7S7SL53_PALFE|nr:pyruvate, phosphate dikinase [Paludibaculum fermentans]QOY87730.1 pyruvate, phosphate dikinase [Paludibaculum fermentans]